MFEFYFRRRIIKLPWRQPRHTPPLQRQVWPPTTPTTRPLTTPPLYRLHPAVAHRRGLRPPTDRQLTVLHQNFVTTRGARRQTLAALHRPLAATWMHVTADTWTRVTAATWTHVTVAIWTHVTAVIWTHVTEVTWTLVVRRRLPTGVPRRTSAARLLSAAGTLEDHRPLLSETRGLPIATRARPDNPRTRQGAACTLQTWDTRHAVPRHTTAASSGAAVEGGQAPPRECPLTPGHRGPWWEGSSMGIGDDEWDFFLWM